MTSNESKLEQHLWEHDGAYPFSDEDIDTLVKDAASGNSYFSYCILRELQQLRKRVKLNDLRNKFEDGYNIKSVLSSPREDWPLNGLYCIDCHEPQYDTPSGAVCKNSHGGAPGVRMGEILGVGEMKGTTNGRR